MRDDTRLRRTHLDVEYKVVTHIEVAEHLRSPGVQRNKEDKTKNRKSKMPGTLDEPFIKVFSVLECAADSKGERWQGRKQNSNRVRDGEVVDVKPDRKQRGD